MEARKNEVENAVFSSTAESFEDMEADDNVLRARRHELHGVDFNRKKVELLIRLVDLCWEMRFSIFSLRTFGKVEPFLGLDETSDKINTKNIFHISGSNETMQNALALVV